MKENEKLKNENKKLIKKLKCCILDNSSKSKCKKEEEKKEKGKEEINIDDPYMCEMHDNKL